MTATLRLEAVKTVPEIVSAIEELPAGEQRQIARILNDRLSEDIEETPEMLAAIDEGIRSSEAHGGREYTRAELEEKVRQWVRGASR